MKKIIVELSEVTLFKIEEKAKREGKSVSEVIEEEMKKLPAVFPDNTYYGMKSKKRV